MLAHRGLAIEAPENTLLAFVAALGIGITHLETDVHASRDGVAVISHDPELERVASRPGLVADLSMAELREVDLGHDQGFCSLAEALDAFPDARFNIDIKAASAIQPTVDAVRAARASERVLLTSFSEARRRAAVRLLPGVATSASGPRFAAALLAGKLRLTPLLRGVLREIDAVQVPVRASGVSIATPRMIELLHAAEVEVHFWTINDPVTMHSLLDLGADGIVSDRADLGLEVLRDRGFTV